MLVACAEPSSPVGWRYPNKSDIKGEWADEYNKKIVPIPYHFSADLNGDGLIDDAWILISTKKDSDFGLFVFFTQKKGDPKIIEINNLGHPKAPGSHPQRYAIVLLPPTTVEQGGVKIKFNYSGIDFLQWENGSSRLFWDKRSNSFMTFLGSD